MRVSILISLAFLISGLVGCASDSKKSLLEERAGYGVNSIPFDINGAKEGSHYVPTRVPEKVVVAWLHKHELPTKDYFWGSWISIVVAPEAWEMVKVKNKEKPTKTMRTRKPRSVSKELGSKEIK